MLSLQRVRLIFEIDRSVIYQDTYLITWHKYCRMMHIKLQINNNNETNTQNSTLGKHCLSFKRWHSHGVNHALFFAWIFSSHRSPNANGVPVWFNSTLFFNFEAKEFQLLILSNFGLFIQNIEFYGIFVLFIYILFPHENL